MSSGLPARRTGSLRPTRSTPSGPSELTGSRLCGVRISTRRHRVHGHPVARGLEREAPHEPDDPGLARRVRGVLGPPVTRAADRAGGEQPAPTGGDHRGHRGPEAAPHATEVRVEGLLPPLVVEVLERDRPRDPGVRDHDVEPPEQLAGARDQAVDGLARANVGLDHGGPPAALGDLRRERLCRRRLTRRDRQQDVRALRRQRERRRRPDPARRAGDHGRPAAQVEHSAPPTRPGLRRATDAKRSTAAESNRDDGIQSTIVRTADQGATTPQISQVMDLATRLGSERVIEPRGRRTTGRRPPRLRPSAGRRPSSCSRSIS